MCRHRGIANRSVKVDDAIEVLCGANPGIHLLAFFLPLSAEIRRALIRGQSTADNLDAMCCARSAKCSANNDFLGAHLLFWMCHRARLANVVNAEQTRQCTKLR